MRIRGITLPQLQTAVAHANVEYKGNLRIADDRAFGTKTPGVQFVLRVCNSRAYGARLSSTGKRHTPSASWEAHRDVFREVFRLNPDAVISTAIATYRGSADFERNFPATANAPMGSRAEPTTIRELSVYP